ncbi:hypothetical protein [Virgibacillus tibetensis]
MKKIIVFLYVFLLLTACSGQEKGELTRVDVKKVNTEGNYEDVVMITDNESIKLLKEAFEHIKWDDKVVNMARKADVKATLFYTFDENMPERLVDYEIWFNENASTATIVSNNENKSYGELDKDNSDTLKNILFK